MSIVDSSKNLHLFQALVRCARQPVCLFICCIIQGSNRKSGSIYFQIVQKLFFHCFNYTLIIFRLFLSSTKRRWSTLGRYFLRWKDIKQTPSEWKASSLLLLFFLIYRRLRLHICFPHRLLRGLLCSRSADRFHRDRCGRFHRHRDGLQLQRSLSRVGFA